MYRAVYAFLDPWVRSFVLQEILSTYTKYDTLDSTPQSIKQGVSFHFMHQKIQQVALQRLFSN